MPADFSTVLKNVLRHKLFHIESLPLGGTGCCQPLRLVLTLTWAHLYAMEQELGERKPDFHPPSHQDSLSGARAVCACVCAHACT